jgi:exopolysaccharide/PEP-CTERM locus tyrosine autokinase
MSIIEQANRRLEELKRAGIEVPTWDAPAAKEERRPLAEPPPKPSQQSRFNAGGELRGAELRAERALRPAATNALVQVGQRQSKSVEVNMARLASAGYLVPGSPRSTLADEFRGIKQPVLKNARPDADAPIRLGNLIMVTSAVPGEGKTFCALNLALSIASEVDSSVLLVDADVVRPAIMERLGLAGSPEAPGGGSAKVHKGLLDLLTDASLDLSEVILKTNVPKLSVLPAGTPRINSTELLASNSMEELLQDISSRYADRIVIFDAPPLLATTESRVLAARMGQILMVVAEGTTGRDEITQAFAAVQACPIVLSMLNRSERTSEHQQYGYGEA